MSSNKTFSLEANKPLSYLLQESNLQDHLPYIDSDNTDIKSKVAYLIKMQQNQSMSTLNPYQYIQQLKILPTPFINSSKFEQQLQRVKNQLTTQNTKKSAKNQNIEIDLEKLSKSKLNIQTLKQQLTKINTSYTNYEQSQLKNLNLQTHKQFSPFLLKQMMQSLQQQKTILKRKIQTEKQEINEINRLRKYEQLQAREKQDVVEQRIKLMVNKRRKLE